MLPVGKQQDAFTGSFYTSPAGYQDPAGVCRYLETPTRHTGAVN